MQYESPARIYKCNYNTNRGGKSSHVHQKSLNQMIFFSECCSHYIRYHTKNYFVLPDFFAMSSHFTLASHFTPKCTWKWLHYCFRYENKSRFNLKRYALYFWKNCDLSFLYENCLMQCTLPLLKIFTWSSGKPCVLV